LLFLLFFFQSFAFLSLFSLFFIHKHHNLSPTLFLSHFLSFSLHSSGSDKHFLFSSSLSLNCFFSFLFFLFFISLCSLGTHYYYFLFGFILLLSLGCCHYCISLVYYCSYCFCSLCFFLLLFRKKKLQSFLFTSFFSTPHSSVVVVVVVAVVAVLLSVYSLPIILYSRLFFLMSFPFV
jgi:hypothetical protein